ncbi:SH3 domain-containing protein [Chloroflexi bacterium TSY]|nr:SH3 domain-containing protein [Chloroflexi bacterium TSY]
MQRINKTLIATSTFIMVLNVLVIAAQTVLAIRSADQEDGVSPVTLSSNSITVRPERTTILDEYIDVISRLIERQTSILVKTENTTENRPWQIAFFQSPTTTIVAASLISSTVVAPNSLLPIMIPNPPRDTSSAVLPRTRSVISPTVLATVTIVTTSTPPVTTTPTRNVLPTATVTPSQMPPVAVTTMDTLHPSSTPTASLAAFPIGSPTVSATATLFSTATITSTPQPLVRSPRHSVRISIPNSHYVNARLEPSERSAVLTILAPGSRAIAVARTADSAWLQILLTNDQQAWVSTEVVFINADQLQNLSVY